MVRKLFLAVAFLLFTYFTNAQDFKGQWKGTFLDRSTSDVGWGGDQCDYVLEIEVKGKYVTGYSYTYFTDGGKKYYTICKLNGFINRPEKYIEIKETERTKTNVPVTIRNCFQVHKLTYLKSDDTETLEGSWEPAPNQQNDCGFGTTYLQRRLLKKEVPLYHNPVVKNNPKKPPVKSIPKQVNKNKTSTVKETVKTKEEVLKPGNVIVQEKVEILEPKKLMQEKIIARTPSFGKRNNTVLKTIEVENATIRVDLYDNGEIDGDSISLFYNGTLLLSHKRLSDKPISLNIKVDNQKEMNELVMYAENLGAIAPNTALMVVTDGPNRYEVRITSDLQKSGTIHFVLRPAIKGN